MMSAYGERLRAVMKSLGWTQWDLADALGLTQTSVSKWIRGENWPDLDSLKRTAEALGVPIDYLVAESDDVDGDELRRAMTLTRLVRELGREEALRRLAGEEEAPKPKPARSRRA